MGGTMRLGAYDCEFEKDSTPAKAYGSTLIQERHRHRFEFNSKYKTDFENAGMSCVGHNPETGLVEVVEIPTLKWFVGVQYHPEYNSTVLRPNPLFIDFVKAGQGLFMLGEMLVFIVILLIGYAYAWKKGALEWD